MASFQVPFVVSPFPEESGPGYVYRLSYENKLSLSELPHGVLSYVSYGLKDIHQKSSGCDSGANRSQIEGALIRLSDFDKSLGSHARFNKFRICPKCMEETPYHRSLWYLDLYRACHQHGLQIRDKCSDCARPYTIQRIISDQCECGTRLSHNFTRKGSSLHAKVATHIRNLAYGMKGGDCDGGFPENLSLPEFLNLLKLIGVVVIPAELKGMRRPQLVKDNIYLDLLVEDAAGWLINWPHDFDRRLKRALSLSKKPGRISMAEKERLGPFRFQNYAEYSFIGDRIKKNLREDWERVFSTSVPVSQNIDAGSLVSVDDIACELGITSRDAFNLCGHGFMPFVMEPDSKGKGYYATSDQSLKEFTSKIYGSVIARRVDEGIGFALLFDACRSNNISIGKLLDQILSGRLSPWEVGRGRFGFKSLQFDFQEVIQFIYSCMNERGRYTIPRAAMTYCLKQSTFKRLVQEQVIDIKVSGNWRLIDPESFLGFHDKYILPGRLAEAHRVSNDKIIKIIERCGGEALDYGGAQKIYLRRSLDMSKLQQDIF